MIHEGLTLAKVLRVPSKAQAQRDWAMVRPQGREARPATQDLRAFSAFGVPGRGTAQTPGVAMAGVDVMKVKENQLLGALEAQSSRRLKDQLKPVASKLGDVICEAGGKLEHAYFPQGAVLSLLTVMESGSAIETANIGREGAFGLFAAMYSRVSFNRCLVQLEGPMLRCPIAVLQEEFDTSANVRNLFVSYSETLLAQVQQTVRCNALHTVSERMCRWLLMMDDRAEGEPMSYTQEFLSEIMGVNRTSVSLAAQSLQDDGLIAYRRGKMQVRDRAALEKASCECYQIVKLRFDAFLNPPSNAAQLHGKGRTSTP